MITLKDLAAELHLSTATISYVLNGQGDAKRVSKKTQDLVMETAARLGYVPNVAAKRLRVSADAPITIGVYLGFDDRLYLMTRFQFGLHHAVQETGRPVQFIYHLYEPGQLSKEQSLIKSDDINAAIICNTSPVDDAFLREKQLNIPAVIVARDIDEYCSIRVNETLTGRIAAAALAASGCRRILAIEGSADLPYQYQGMEKRSEGFAMTARSCGIEYRLQKRFRDIEKNLGFLDPENEMYYPCDGIYIGDGRLIGPLLKRLREKKIRVPEDMKLVSISLFGPEYLSTTITPSISTISHPLEEEARQALSMILRQLNGEISSPESVTLAASYLPYESCGPLPEDFK